MVYREYGKNIKKFEFLSIFCNGLLPYYRTYIGYVLPVTLDRSEAMRHLTTTISGVYTIFMYAYVNSFSVSHNGCASASFRFKVRDQDFKTNLFS